MGKAAWGVEAAGALKRFGEQLMRRAESDPRLARAVEQGYDLRNPTLHGTNAVLPADDTLKHIYSTPEPGQALNYTGGRVMRAPGAEAIDGTARFIMNPAVVRSPFAEFKEEGVGLMKAKGGLVQMRDCNCGN